MYPSQSHRDAFGINNNAVYFSSVLTKKFDTDICEFRNASAVKLRVLSCHFYPTVNKHCNLITSVSEPRLLIPFSLFFPQANVAPKWPHLRLQARENLAEAEGPSQRDTENASHAKSLHSSRFDSLECAWACHACKMYGVPLPTRNHEVMTWRAASFPNRRSTTANATCYNMLVRPGSQGRLIPTISIWKCFHVAIC